MLLLSCKSKPNLKIMTVTGEISASDMGVALTHEHVLVDFAGVDSISPNRYVKDSVIAKVMPYLNNLKQYKVHTFVECTPEYLGRDPKLLVELSKRSGIKFITNTGWYAANDRKHLPHKITNMNAKDIANVWINEAKNGIDNTGVKPGFIKIAINNFKLTETEKKLVQAAAITHLETGLTIMSHTGLSEGAFAQLKILKQNGVDPSAFIWTHANVEPNMENFAIASDMGAWVAFDGIDDNYAFINRIVKLLKFMKSTHSLEHVLLSHDAGWYSPTEPKGGKFRTYTTLFDTLIPLLKAEGFTDQEIELMIVKNPTIAFAIRVRKINDMH